MNNSNPVTLRQMAKANPKSPALSASVLVIIDAQEEYLSGHVPLPTMGPALASIERLLAAARQQGSSIIHVAHRGKPGGLFARDRGGRIVDSVSPADGEPVIEKGLPNSFAGTALGEDIERLGKPNLIICGFMTRMCVSSTARAALDLGLTTTVISDASSTRDLPTADGRGVVGHQTLHEASLAALADRFSCLATADELLSPQ